MSRFFQKIDLDTFKAKIKETFMCKKDVSLHCKQCNHTHDDSKDEYCSGFIFEWLRSATIKSDIKVQFDMENYSLVEEDSFAGYMCGIHTLPNGMHALFINAGGDWEFPICFIVYWSGKGLRAYVPTDGNVWNRKYKCAYGSEVNFECYEEEEWDGEEDLLATKVNNQSMISDIMNRVKEKTN